MKRIKSFVLCLAAAGLVLVAACEPMGSPLPPYIPSEPKVQTSLDENPHVSSEESKPVSEDKFATVSLGGDILLHTNLFNTAKTGDKTYDFLPFLQNGMEGFFDSDLNIVNMENPVDVYGDNSKISTYPNFNAPREILDFAKALGVDTAVFCNNHIYDKKYSGFLATLENLRQSGLEVVGAYSSEEEYNTHFIKDINGIKIGILAYTDHVNSYSDSELTPFSVRTFKLSMDSAPQMVADIAALKNAGAEAVMVFLHWGSEYRDSPADVQKKLARALCEGGADIIVGGHSHCVQPIEGYSYINSEGEEKSSLIIYSMGNFFADQTSLQTMSGYGVKYAKTQYGMKVTLKLKKDGETGKISIAESEYLPTFFFRKKVSGKYEYLFIESGKYAFAEERPEIFSTDAEWQKCKDSFEHVTNIVGDTVPVKKYTE